ncbi:hypothetical protein K438DRAFT_2017327 [Mycena galopus ATCC 62051]|nr:hypothetical protein K438DRAFT_2017327 [Mycena galopus ATCC 62051]
MPASPPGYSRRRAVERSAPFPGARLARRGGAASSAQKEAESDRRICFVALGNVTPTHRVPRAAALLLLNLTSAAPYVSYPSLPMSPPPRPAARAPLPHHYYSLPAPVRAPCRPVDMRLTRTPQLYFAHDLLLAFSCEVFGMTQLNAKIRYPTLYKELRTADECEFQPNLERLSVSLALNAYASSTVCTVSAGEQITCYDRQEFNLQFMPSFLPLGESEPADGLTPICQVGQAGCASCRVLHPESGSKSRSNPPKLPRSLPFSSPIRLVLLIKCKFTLATAAVIQSLI